jgi:hypothetical protein
MKDLIVAITVILWGIIVGCCLAYMLVQAFQGDILAIAGIALMTLTVLSSIFIRQKRWG